VGAVLFDRDGTLVIDVPYNSDPALVRPVPGARSALDLLRDAGIPTGIVTNQSGIARGLLTADQAAAVTARVVELLGPFASVRTCPTAPTRAAAAASRRPAWCSTPPPSSGSTPPTSS
jgi:HAD superfamily hydrolase (TIGR01662 family)